MDFTLNETQRHWQLKARQFAEDVIRPRSLARDRTELHDLAAKEPERLKVMVETWHRIAAHDLMATPAETKPVSDKVAKTHGEWSDYVHANGANTSRRRGKGENSEPADP